MAISVVVAQARAVLAREDRSQPTSWCMQFQETATVRLAR